LKYEEFVDNPIHDLERICAHCQIGINNDMVNATKDMVKSDRKVKWQRFDPRDLARIIPEINDEMQRHGYEIPPEIAQSIENLYPNETMNWPSMFGERKSELYSSQIKNQN
jgi:hypothetical protein